MINKTCLLEGVLWLGKIQNGENSGTPQKVEVVTAIRCIHALCALNSPLVSSSDPEGPKLPFRDSFCK